RDEYATSGHEHEIVDERPESVVSGRRVTRGPVSARAREAEHPDPLKLLISVWPPMLATLATPRELSRPPYVFEVKYDGFRALAGVSNGRVSLQSRNGLDLSARFPSIARALAQLEVTEAVLDGEIVAFDETGTPRFEALQTSAPDQRYCVFDLLW